MSFFLYCIAENVCEGLNLASLGKAQKLKLPIIARMYIIVCRLPTLNSPSTFYKLAKLSFYTIVTQSSKYSTVLT